LASAVVSSAGSRRPDELTVGRQPGLAVEDDAGGHARQIRFEFVQIQKERGRG